MHEPLCEAKDIATYTYLLTKALYEKFGQALPPSLIPPTSSTLEEVKAAYDAMPLSDAWLTKYGAGFKPSGEQLITDGKVDMFVDKDDPLLGFRDIPIIDASGTPTGDFQVPGKLYNSTGLINFFSPFWHVRMNMAITGGTRGAVVDYSGGPSGDYYGPGWRTATAKYIPVPGGYEDMFDNKNPKTGNFVGYAGNRQVYKLLYMTNKSRNRGHTAVDSTAILKDQYKQTVRINPVNAGERGINNGDMVYVYNDRGCIKIPAEVTHEVLPGYVSIIHGAWHRPHPDPTETVRVWLKNRLTTPPTYEEIIAPVDVGGTDNVLVDDDFTLDTPFSCQTLAAQTGPCEVSKVKPN
jgi:formylmethanofuran dehydrogenase subunit D